MPTDDFTLTYHTLNNYYHFLSTNLQAYIIGVKFQVQGWHKNINMMHQT